MKFLENHFKLIALAFLALVLCLFYFASGTKQPKESNFVGTWKSSKLTSPLSLYENGEWEIKTAGGAILQYGVWRYEDKKIIWSVKVGSTITHDANAVLSTTPNEFQLIESDGTTTKFKRIEASGADAT
jgi:hypothetical protein